MLVSIAVICAAYLIGSIPFGLLAGKLRGVDIRTRGSGNVGATNAYRTLGPAVGIVVFALDVAKGALPTLLAMNLSRLAPPLSGPATDTWHSVVLVLTGMAVIAGHNWSLYLGFQGGKGVATGAGVLLVLFPLFTAVLLIVWIIVVATTRYVSAGSIVISALFPVLVVAFHHGNVVYVVFSLAAAAVVLFRHRSNIGRLLAGTEPRIWSSTQGESGSG